MAARGACSDDVSARWSDPPQSMAVKCYCSGSWSYMYDSEQVKNSASVPHCVRGTVLRSRRLSRSLGVSVIEGELGGEGGKGAGLSPTPKHRLTCFASR